MLDFPSTGEQSDAQATKPAPDSVAPEPLVRADEYLEYRQALARFRSGEWDADRWATFRLRFGVYAQKQAEKFMIRAKLPGGRLSFAQARAVARANRDHCGSDPHITTRQNFQFYFLSLDGTADFIEALNKGGLTTREASGNTFRNVTACPFAGVCPKEHVDAGEVAERLSTTWLRHPLVQHMPRKFKATVSGCAQDCGASTIDDLGFIAIERNGKQGFRVTAGGGLGNKPIAAVEIAAFIEEFEMAAVQEALARLHQRFSNRKRKMQSRIKFLVERFGAEKFVELFEEEFERAKKLSQRPWQPLDWRQPTGDKRPPLPGGRIDQHDGKVAVVIRPPLGMVSSDQLEALADIAEDAEAREFRLEREQNLILIGVPQVQADRVISKIRALGLEITNEKEALGNLVSCPGTSTCPIGITNSNGLAEDILGDRDFFNGLPETRIRISGCHNSCGQHHIGEFGLHGLSKKIGGQPAPYYQLHLGGSYEHDGAVGLPGPFVPARHAKQALTILIADYRDTRLENEAVRQWVERLGMAHIQALLQPLGASLDAEEETLFIDFGESDPFTSAVAGAGECASPVVVGEFLADLAEAATLNIDRALEIDDWTEALRSANATVISAARRLLLVDQYEPKDASPDHILAEVRARYSLDQALLTRLDQVLASVAEVQSGGDLDRLKADIRSWLDAVTVAVEAKVSIPEPIKVPA
ncbi:MAG: nitrite/sulfite reductase [Rhodospirillales bacterium]|nr:nitrite/sulfite reductase [Rhodospirillales bacterium]